MTASRLPRAAAAAGTGVVVLLALTACSLLGSATPTSAPATPRATATDVIDPSVPSATPVSTPTAAATSATPVATVTAAAPTATATPVDSRKRVVPFITSAEWDPKAKQLDVSGIVPTVLEKSGTCTVTVTMGGTTRTETSAAVPASSYTGCETVSIDGLATGSWTVRIGYSSPTSAGLSALRTVTVG